MARKTEGPATRIYTTRREATALKIQLSCVLLVVPLLGSAVNEAAAWKDQGHMLVAAIAREVMKPTTLSRVEGVLQMWKSQYPTTSSLESASVWLDHLACKHAGDYCNFTRQDGIQLFKTWHYCSVPWNPQDIPLRLIDKVLPLPVGGADWALYVIYSSLRGCTGDNGRLNPSEKRGAGGKERRRRRYKGRRTLRRFRQQTGASAGVHVGRQHEQPHGYGTAAAEKHQEKHYHRLKRAAVSGKTNGLSTYPAVVPMEVYSRGAAEEAGKAGQARSYSAADFAGDLPGHISGVLPRAGGVCSVLSYSLYLRILIHVFGDIHQPLHASEVFSKVFPRGDYGGNRIYVIPPHVGGEAEMTTAEQSVESTSTLHGEWDSLFGQYSKFFHHIDIKELRDEAKRLLQTYPMEDKARNTFGDFVAIIRESHQYVRDFVYSEFDWTTFSYDFLPYKPSEEYVARTRRIGEERLTLAGTRLAYLLDSIAEFLPHQPLSSIPGITGAGLIQSGTHHSAGNTGGRHSSHGDKKSYGLLFSKETRSIRQRARMASAALASSIPPAVATYAVLLLLVILLAALWIAWKQMRLYRRALQVVLRGGAAAEVCSRAAAAAEVGDWKGAAALLREYDNKERSPHGEGGGEASTVNDRAARFSGVSASRLLTT